jgi:hypothetical protein
MKVYTIFLDGNRGWTSSDLEGFQYEYKECIKSAELCEKEILTEEELESKIESLNIGESFGQEIGLTDFAVKCEEMSEEEFNNLPEFSGW